MLSFNYLYCSLKIQVLAGAAAVIGAGRRGLLASGRCVEGTESVLSRALENIGGEQVVGALQAWPLKPFVVTWP